MILQTLAAGKPAGQQFGAPVQSGARLRSAHSTTSHRQPLHKHLQTADHHDDHPHHRRGADHELTHTRRPERRTATTRKRQHDARHPNRGHDAGRGEQQTDAVDHTGQRTELRQIVVQERELRKEQSGARKLFAFDGADAQERHGGQPVRTESGQHTSVHEPPERTKETKTVAGLAISEK